MFGSKRVLQSNHSFGLVVDSTVWSSLTFTSTCCKKRHNTSSLMERIYSILKSNRIRKNYGCNNNNGNCGNNVLCFCGMPKIKGCKNNIVANYSRTSQRTRHCWDAGSFEKPTSQITCGLGTVPAGKSGGRKRAPNIEVRIAESGFSSNRRGMKQLTMALGFTLYLKGATVPSS